MAKQIDMKDVDIYYSDHLAVQDVTLTIPPRSVTAFIGPSGCGKSSVLRTLNRLHELIPGAAPRPAPGGDAASDAPVGRGGRGRQPRPRRVLQACKAEAILAYNPGLARR